MCLLLLLWLQNESRGAAFDNQMKMIDTTQQLAKISGSVAENVVSCMTVLFDSLFPRGSFLRYVSSHVRLIDSLTVVWIVFVSLWVDALQSNAMSVMTNSKNAMLLLARLKSGDTGDHRSPPSCLFD